MGYYQLGQLPTAKDIIERAYGTLAHPMTPETLRCEKLKRDGKIAYEVSRGQWAGVMRYGVHFARITDRGRYEKMAKESGIFHSEVEVDGWVDAIEKSNGTVS